MSGRSFVLLLPSCEFVGVDLLDVLSDEDLATDDAATAGAAYMIE